MIKSELVQRIATANPHLYHRDVERIVNVIFESPKGPYFFKLTGPAKAVEKHKKDFDEWVKNFK